MKKYLFLEELRKRNIKPFEFAEKAGVSYSKLNKQLNNKVSISTKEAKRYCDLLHIDDFGLITQIFLSD